MEQYLPPDSNDKAVQIAHHTIEGSSDVPVPICRFKLNL